jgi:hypothetical protein
MTVNQILSWMGESSIAHFVLDNAWVFPTLETLHFVGLILLAGSIFVVDLRFVGIASAISLRSLIPLLPISLLGFAINLTTGILFIFSDPFTYYPNLAFRLKMLAVLLAGCNALWFKFALDWENLTDVPGQNAHTSIRWVAGLSLVLWTSVIVLGRMIPYFEGIGSGYE